MMTDETNREQQLAYELIANTNSSFFLPVVPEQARQLSCKMSKRWSARIS